MKLFFVCLSSFLVFTAYGQSASPLTTAIDQSYGYIQENPLKMKRGNAGKSYGYFMMFLDRLTTEDGQRLVMLDHKTLRDADYVKPNPLVKDYQRGMFKKSVYGVPGLIERYRFITETSKDTITLFVDFNSRGALKVPDKLQLAKS
jgi:hypothetical protein